LDDTLEQRLNHKSHVRISDLSVLFLAPHKQILAHEGALLGDKYLKHLLSWREVNLYGPDVLARKEELPLGRMKTEPDSYDYNEIQTEFTGWKFT